MGQKSSKRQSYTPGGTQDAGLPTATVTENGDLRTGGANGQVRLISNRESQYGDVITSDVTSTSSPAVAAEASSPAHTEKKKRKRFVFSLKRTGSGKRSKRGRKKEANGVRPISYPPPPSSADQTTGLRANDRDRKAQSMFVETVSDDLQDDVIQASLSADDVATAEEEVSIQPFPAKKISADSTASSSKGHKDRKKNGSHKHKSSKKKDKEPKKKSKKKKEEPDKAKKEEEEEEEQTVAVAAVAATEETATAAATAEETATTAITAEETPSAAAVAAVAAAITAAAAKEENEEAVKPEEMVILKGDSTTQEQELVAEATAPEDSEITDLAQAARKEEKAEETEPLSSHTEEPVEEPLALTVAAVSEAEVKVTLLDDSPEEAEEEPAMTAEQLVAEIEQTILSKEHSFHSTLTEAAAAAAAAEQAPPEPQQESKQAGEAETSLLVPGGEENVELAGQVLHEDILELSDISSPATETAEHQGSGSGSGSGQEEKEEGDLGAPQTDIQTTTVEEVMEQTVTAAEVQSAVEVVREEAEVDTVLQQEVEQLVKSSPSTSAAIHISEEEAQGETEPIQHKPPQDTETLQSTAQVPEDGMAAASVSESAAHPAPQPVQGTLQPLTPAQLKALEKELKANKKKEEKERARREKEEKKRLKEEKKREAKEKKRKEKEEKEQRLREAKEKVKAAAHMTVEVRGEEVEEEEAVQASQTKMAQSAPGTSASGDSQLQQQTSAVDPQPSTSADDGGKETQLSVGAPTDSLPAPSSPTTPADLPTDQKKAEEQVLGSSVKEIISSIENNVDMEPKTYDESSPPEVPDSPYPEEDVMAQSSALSQFSPPAPVSPESSAPSSPSSPSSPVALGDSSASETTLESPSALKSVAFPPEVSETARSSVLRRIELGPRLRTAILRKSSSGAESEEKRVSLTQPRHVQVSDITPPPRKPRPRRTLEHTRDSSGNYTYSSSSLTPSPGKEPEPVLEEQVSAEASGSSESSPVSGQERQRGEAEDLTVTATSQVEEKGEVEENLTAAVSSSVSQPLELSSPPSQQTADSPEEKSTAEDKVQISQQLMENFASSGSELSEPDPATLMAVASIVHAGQTGSADRQSVGPEEAAGQGAVEQGEVHSAAQSAGDPKVPEDRVLQEVAAQVVVRVQRAAQEKASALDLQEKLALNLPDTDTQVKVTTETGDSCEKVGSEQGEGGEGSEEDSDNEVGLMQATVVCSAELVTPSSPCADSSDPGQWKSSSTEPATHSEALLPEKTENSPAPSNTECNPGDDKAEEADENKSNPDDKNEQDNSSDTSQLQQFNKNYYDISVVVDDDNDNDNDEDDNSSKTPTADNPEAKDNHTEESSASSSQPSPSSPPSSSPSEGPRTPSTSPQQQKEVSPLSENGEKPGREEGSKMVGVSVRCNGSHVLETEEKKKEENEKEKEEKEADSSIDALLKLHSGVNGEKQVVVVDTLEHNNNVSVEVEKPATDREETTATADTNDSRD